MPESSVVFLDSGIGGLPYLEWVKEKHPDIPTAYVADTANFPYGESSIEKVRDDVSATAKRIFAMGEPSMLVLACNTASVAALDEIRSFAPCPVVGTVPAVKSAAGLRSPGAIGVLATQGTVRSPYLDGLIEDFAAGKTIVRVAAGDIVRYVEEQWLEDGEEGALPVMEPALRELHASGVGSVVLGCTHFLHVMAPIERYLGDDVILVDSREGVGKRILSLLENAGESACERPGGSAAKTGRGAVEPGFYVTESDGGDERYRDFARRFGLKWAGELP